jgi:hypothetical protein
MSVDALLKLREDVGHALTGRADDLIANLNLHRGLAKVDSLR